MDILKNNREFLKSFTFHSHFGFLGKIISISTNRNIKFLQSPKSFFVTFLFSDEVFLTEKQILL